MRSPFRSAFPFGVLLAFLPLLAFGCTPRLAPPTPTGPVQGAGPDDLAEARARWEAVDVSDYTYTIERQCFCPEQYRGPFAVQVEDGAITEATWSGGAAGDDVEIPTVEALFQLIARSYAEGADEVRVTYDGPRGYPTSVWIDRSRGMADEEVGYTVSAFQPVAGR